VFSDDLWAILVDTSQPGARFTKKILGKPRIKCDLGGKSVEKLTRMNLQKTYKINLMRKMQFLKNN